MRRVQCTPCLTIVIGQVDALGGSGPGGVRGNSCRTGWRARVRGDARAQPRLKRGFLRCCFYPLQSVDTHEVFGMHSEIRVQKIDICELSGRGFFKGETRPSFLIDSPSSLAHGYEFRLEHHPVGPFGPIKRAADLASFVRPAHVMHEARCRTLRFAHSERYFLLASILGTSWLHPWKRNKALRGDGVLLGGCLCAESPPRRLLRLEAVWVMRVEICVKLVD